jgi:hypothetical protein
MKKCLFLIMLLAFSGVSEIWAGPFDEDQTVVIKHTVSTGEAAPAATGEWHVAVKKSVPAWLLPVNGTCASGYFTSPTSSHGADACLICPEGKYISSKDRCVVCESGYSYNEGNDRCQK